MPAEAVNTMVQNAFVKLSDGKYALVVESSPPTTFQTTSEKGGGQQTSPTSSMEIGATGSLPTGVWDVEIYSSIGGTTAAATDTRNMEIMHAGASFTRIVNPIPGTAGVAGQGFIRYRYNGGGVISVRASAAGTAGAVYAVTIIATRVG